MSDPDIVSVVKVGGRHGYADPDYRIQYSRCTFCEQTSLEDKKGIEHHPDCPHHGKHGSHGASIDAAVLSALAEAGGPVGSGELAALVNEELELVRVRKSEAAQRAKAYAEAGFVDVDADGRFRYSRGGA